jgi:hypothetical protein
MIEPEKIDLDSFVGASAPLLGLELDEPAQAAASEALRGLVRQAAFVLDHPLGDEP